MLPTKEQANLLAEINKTIKFVNENRSKVIEQYVSAFLAVHAPPDFDYKWVVKNTELVVKQVYQGGVMTEHYSVELRTPKRGPNDPPLRFIAGEVIGCGDEVYQDPESGYLMRARHE